MKSKYYLEEHVTGLGWVRTYQLAGEDYHSLRILKNQRVVEEYTVKVTRVACVHSEEYGNVHAEDPDYDSPGECRA